MYVLGIIQLVTLFTPLLGGSAAAGAVAMALSIAATLWPWHLFVRWCVRRADPRTAVALAAVDEPLRDEESAAERAERVLREAVGDPAAYLKLRRSAPGPATAADCWIGVDGALIDAPSEGALELTDAAGRPIAALEHDLRFADLRPLRAAVRPLIERARWEAELREQSERVAAERARADAAAVEARRRIERDLHDGVQGRLVSLGLGLSLARDDAPDPLARDVLAHAVAELQGAVVELRELAGGTLSRRLDGRGLADAVGELAARVPLLVELEIPARELPAHVESTAYFVIAESLTNAVKHAAAGRVRVRVSGDEVVTVLIADDGCGGADVRGGTGLRGLQERVHSVGGSLVVGDGTPTGTVVEAVLPCGS
ncbi:MAG: histidine kinase [Luteolibacter sp.]